MNRKMPIDPNEVFPQVENMLYSLAWSTAKKYPVTFEEARSEAYFAFMKACTEYSRAKSKGGKFSSWCYFKTWTHLKTWITKRTNDRLVFMENNDREDTMAIAAPATVSSHIELVEDLSEDAREMVNMLVETPAELLGLSMSPKRFMKRVKECLVKKGKTKQQVERAHRELLTTFQTAWA